MNNMAVEEQAMEKRHRLLFADDHRMILDAFSVVAGSQYDVQVVNSAHEFEEAVRSNPPDLAILDITMPDGDGFVAARRARSYLPDLKVMFLSMHTETKYMKQATELGACGFVSKSSPAGELMGAIETVVNGGTYRSGLSQSISNESADSSELTDRQKQVLRLISQGMSAKEIANDLKISVRTAEFHRAAIMERLKLNSTAMMTRYAIDHGIG